MNEENKVEMPLASWVALCENNIYNFAKQQMNQSGIPIDLQTTVIKCVMSRIQQDYINVLINQNAELILNRKEGQENADSDG